MTTHNTYLFNFPAKAAHLAHQSVSFGGLMQLYSKNFCLMQQLLEEPVSTHKKNQCPGKKSPPYNYQLKVCRVSKNKWTSAWMLSYYLAENSNAKSFATLLDIQIQLYHDSRQAEITHPNLITLDGAGNQNIQNDLVEKWYANYFLFNVLLFFYRRKNCLKTTSSFIIST